MRHPQRSARHAKNSWWENSRAVEGRARKKINVLLLPMLSTPIADLACDPMKNAVKRSP